MSNHLEFSEKGSQALAAADYPAAITHYSKAIELLPTSPNNYIKRSTAYQRSAKYELALADAELAVKLGKERGVRETIGMAQLRRGISLYLLERYGDAGFCFGVAKKLLGDKEKSLSMWFGKLDMVLKDTDRIPEDDFRREVTVKEIPDVEIPKAKPVEAPVKKEEVKAEAKKPEEPKPAPPPVPQGVTTPRDKIRNEWYQTATHVVFTLYVKGVPKDSATVEIEEHSISISFPLPNNSDFTYDLDPLFAPINPAASSFSVLSTKIELKLAKVNTGQKWAALEGVAQPKGKDKEEEDVVDSPKAPTSPSRTQPPTYPTSSKKGPKNWDKVADELSKKPGATGEEEADDDDESDPVNSFFKKLYKDADPDTRRAMMKSYIESNGTALSTNWGEVGKGKVETSPPEGLVAKKWHE
ncbi:SGS domain-containing protein [Peziza echinospora]|nr:SGS domain-containing protein [Peziza echinospora]